MNNDRGMKKWQPFDSLTNTKKLKHELQLKKIKKEKPILSEDQLSRYEDIIKEAYFDQEIISISYFLNGEIFTKKNKIKKINNQQKQIILSDGYKIHYKQITNVKK